MAIEQSGRSPLVVRDTRPEISSLHNRDGWNLTEQDYHGNVRDLVKWAVLAPSSHNTQPWRFDVEDAAEGKRPSITISPDLQRELPASDPTRREMYISVGAAAEYLKVAGRYFGWNIRETYQEDNERQVLTKQFTFEPGYERTEEDEKRFHAVTQRVSNRNPHTEEAVPASFKEKLLMTETPDSTQIDLIENKEKLNTIGQLVYQGDKQILSDPSFTKELSEHVTEDDDPRGTGMTLGSLGVTDPIIQRFAGDMIRSGGLAEIMPQEDKIRIAEKTASVGAITTQDDSETSWIEAGEAFAKVALDATVEGMSANVMAVLVETSDLRDELAHVIGAENRKPQIMFRLGYPESPTTHSARRKPFEAITVGRGPERQTVHENKVSIFTLQEGSYELEDLRKELGGDELTVRDQYAKGWMTELVMMESFDITKDAAGMAKLQERIAAKGTSPYHGKWVYFPWSRTLEHIPDEEIFYKVRFSRNNPVISEEDQRKIRDLHVGVIGLSIGGIIAQSSAKLGVGHLKIADFDVMEASNGPRGVMDSVRDIGTNKTLLLAREIMEFNPYIDLEMHPSGIDMGNFGDFMKGLDVVVDHMDNLPFKLALRQWCIDNNHPAHRLMATALGWQPTNEIEVGGDPTMFNSRVPEEILEILKKRPESKAEFAALASLIMGHDNMDTANFTNFSDVIEGKSNVLSQIHAAGLALAARDMWVLYMIARGEVNRIPKLSSVPVRDPLAENFADRQERDHAVHRFLQLTQADSNS